ncbi:MAG: InlB B-repeat-containing protein [Oscillospiraceae bacterium]|nr:InlB B-repeat-containing protein [Oscillospiraceae bacterium]
MKKTFAPKLLALCLALLTLLSLAGCKQAETGDAADPQPSAGEIAQEPADQQEAEPTAEPEADTRTVTFYDSDGETVLNTVEVPLGETIQPEDPEKEGYAFIGWFATPKLTRAFDFTRGIREDTSVYAGFASWEEDTREFAILGFGTSPLLAESNWGAVINDEHRMTKEDAEGRNVYTITVDLEEGDLFQFAIDSSWADQRGFGYIEDGQLDGTEYLKGNAGLGGGDTRRANIEVAVSGNYTFTLVTYPGEDSYLTTDPQYSEEGKENFNVNPFDTITWTYNG